MTGRGVLLLICMVFELIADQEAPSDSGPSTGQLKITAQAMR
jgi:hypothetical protein